MNFRLTRMIVLASLLFLTACASQSNTLPYQFSDLPASGDPAAGRALYESGTAQVPACSACHSLDGRAETGPSFQGLAARAGSRVAGQDREHYVFNSILTPNTYVVPGYASGIMPQNYGKTLDKQQIRNLISFLLTLN